jgi:hypothetical protein
MKPKKEKNRLKEWVLSLAAHHKKEMENKVKSKNNIRNKTKTHNK